MLQTITDAQLAAMIADQSAYVEAGGDDIARAHLAGMLVERTRRQRAAVPAPPPARDAVPVPGGEG